MSALVPADSFIPDGVWLDLPFDDYIAQDALGSSDLIALFKKRHGWWWSSRHNPDHVRVEKAEQNYGSALHAIVLEGVGAYQSRFAAPPAWPEGALYKIDQMKAELREAGYKLVARPGQKPVSQWLLEDWCAAMRDNLPRVPVMQNLDAAWRARIGDNVTVLTAAEDRMLRLMASILLDPRRGDNAEIRKLFDSDGGHPPLAEVSILKTMPDGTRRRWRIDRMFPRFDIDLKSLGNWSGRPLEWATGDSIAKYGYDIQRADYYEGRTVLNELVADGKLYGGTPEQRQWIRRFPQEFERWDWVWLFYQKPDSRAGRAPVLFPIWDDSWEAVDPNIETPIDARYFEGAGYLRPSDLRRYGNRKKAKALQFYRDAVAEFGLDKPWARIEAVHYADDSLSPAIHLPNWIVEEEPADPAAYAT